MATTPAPIFFFKKVKRTKISVNFGPPVRRAALLGMKARAKRAGRVRGFSIDDVGSVPMMRRTEAIGCPQQRPQQRPQSLAPNHQSIEIDRLGEEMPASLVPLRLSCPNGPAHGPRFPPHTSVEEFALGRGFSGSFFAVIARKKSSSGKLGGK